MRVDVLTVPLLFIVLSAASLAAPISTNPANYAIVGESGVSLNTYSTAWGDVYSGGDLNLQFGYGIQDSPNAGNMISMGNVNVGTLSDVTGNIYANGGVSLTGDDTITGNIVYGTSYGNSGGNVVSGTVTQAANSVPTVNLPSAVSFTPGTNDISTASNLTLAPGSYGNVTESGQFQNIYLSSGDYYLKSLNVPSGGYLYLNITNAPIRVFVQGNINIGSELETYLNGQSSGTTSLASSVLFQTGGNFNLAGANTYNFYGTVFTPSGSVSLSIGQMNGSIMSSGSISSTTYLTKAPYNWSNLPVLSIATTSATVITGGTANIGVSLTNLGVSGGSAMNYALAATVSSGSLAGIQSFSQSGSLAAQASQSVVSVPTTSANIGVNALTIAATGANSFNGPQTATATLTVLAHAVPILSTSTASVGRVMRNTVGTAGSVTLSDSAGAYGSGLQITNLPAGLSGYSVGNLISSGGSTTISCSLSTALTGTASASYTIDLSDNLTLAGATALPSLSFTVTGTVLDNRVVTAQANTNLGYIHVGGAGSAALLLSTTGDDSHFTRVTVADSAAADANGISVSGGSTGLRFGYDAMSDLRTIGGTLNSSVPVGSFSGSLTLVTGAESGVTGAQSPVNVIVNYTGKAYSGKAAWSGSAGGSWGTMTNWQDTQAGGPNGGAPGISGFAGDTASFGDSIGSSAATVSLDGQNPVLNSLSFATHLGGSYNITSGSGGQITVNGGTADSVITVNGGNQQISAPLVLAGTADFNIVNPQDSLTVAGNIGGQSPINKLGAGLLTITGTRSLSAVTTISAGTLQGNASNVANVTNNGTLVLNQPSDAVYSATMTGGGGFIKSGPGMLTLAAADNLSTTGSITIQQGTLSAPLGIPHNGGGIQVSSGGTLQAAESVIRSVSGNGAVVATGDLTIGQSAQPGQFNMGGAPGTGGTLIAGSNAVVILSADAAVLGSQTTLGPGGSLTTLNGAQLGNASSLDATKVLTATGSAEINSSFVNNGMVNGPTASGQMLTFKQFVNGAGSTTGNVEYAAGYSPGNCPAAVSAQNVLFDTTSTLILELAGDMPGSGYDQLDISGQATLNGTLDIELLGGFTPSAGESFQVFDGVTAGSFAQINMPVLGNGLSWNTNALYSTGQVSVVPEPGTLALLAAGGIGLLAAVRRRRYVLAA